MTPPPEPSGPGHSDIFERLGASSNDLTGLVAYGLYQLRKRSWIGAFHEKYGRYPTPEERGGYAFSLRDDAVEALRAEAEGVMAAFVNQAIEDQAQELRGEAVAAETRSVLSEINSKLAHLGGYWHHILGHLVGFVILVGIAAIFVLLIAFEPSLEKIFHWIAEKIRT
jgi:hypothetical protein